MTTFIDKSDIQTKAKYTWLLEDYSMYESYKTSPTFSPENDANIKFCLRFFGRNLYCNRKCDDYDNYYNHPQNDNADCDDNVFYSIALCLQSPIQKEVSVLYQIAIIDANGKLRLPYESRSLFYVNSIRSDILGYQEARHGLKYEFSKVYLDNHKLAPNDELKIFCEVFVLDNPNVRIMDPYFEYPNGPKNQILEDYGTLLQSGDHSDVVLVVGKKEFNLHKNILSTRSPVFSAMFSCDLEESKQNRVTITDMNLKVAELLLPYIYTGKIPSMKEYGLELFFAADKYQLEHLKAICETNLIKTLSVETVAKTLLLADMHSAAFLKKRSIEFITRNSDKVKTTKGWSEMLKNRPELLIELYNDLSTKASQLFKN